MAYYRKRVQVGWVDEYGNLYEMAITCVAPGLTLTPCYAAVGEWVDDGNDCRFCNTYIGYGSSYTFDGKTECPTCHHLRINKILLDESRQA